MTGERPGMTGERSGMTGERPGITEGEGLAQHNHYQGRAREGGV